MFSGIVEKVAVVTDIETSGTNITFALQVELDEPLYIDQSISHNGVCLTVIDINEEDHIYKVVAIKETLERSNLGLIKVGSHVNIERSIRMNTRMDGHMVSGHVDSTAKMLNVIDEDGSWVFTFKFDPEYRTLLIPKGSVTINGISLTIKSLTDEELSVAIIPYTYENTNLKHLIQGDTVNFEFDIFGKYVINYMEKVHG